MGVSSLLPLCWSWGSNSSSWASPGMCFIVGCSFCGSLAFYLGAKTKSRGHLSLQGTSTTLHRFAYRTKLHILHPICKLPRDHKVCIQSQWNTSRVLPLYLESTHQGYDFCLYWKEGHIGKMPFLHVQESSEKGRLLRSGVFCPFYFPSIK